MLERTRFKAGYLLRIYEESRDDPDRAVRMLKREYVFEMLDIDGSQEQAARIGALAELLSDRKVSVTRLRMQLVGGDLDVAPTPPLAAGRSTAAPTKPANNG